MQPAGIDTVALPPVPERPAEPIEAKPEDKKRGKVAFVNFPCRKPVACQELVHRFQSSGSAAVESVATARCCLLLRPDFVALVVLYWSINQPQRVGMSVAFTMAC